MIGNGHHIKIGTDPSVNCPWDESFELEFQTADENFPQIIDWLDTLDRCDPPFDRPIASRIVHQSAPDDQFNLLIECLISLAARSPMHREQGVALAEHYRGPLPERERNGLIGMNIRHTHRNAVRAIGGGGKMMVIFSPEREFIFGDGFFSNLTVQGQHWHHPKILAPVTPWLSVLFVRPMRYMTEPRLVTLVASPDETDALNYAVQVYSRNSLFYRSELPLADDSFKCGKHRIFKDDRNSVDALIHHIPGIPPRDTSFDFFDNFLNERGLK
jgi:hypothetical protein